MGTILLLLILFFIVYPLVKAGIAVWRARRQYRDLEDQFRRAFFGENAQASGSSAKRDGRRKTGAAKQPPASKKKIDPSMGEYVDFQEVRSAEATNSSGTTTNSTRTNVRVESQIEDVEWEDVK